MVHFVVCSKWYIIMLVSWVSATDVIFAIVRQRVSLVSVSRSVRA